MTTNKTANGIPINYSIAFVEDVLNLAVNKHKFIDGAFIVEHEELFPAKNSVDEFRMSESFKTYKK